jgi:Type VI secretion system (T6SS), amidase effector protein 4
VRNIISDARLSTASGTAPNITFIAFATDDRALYNMFAYGMPKTSPNDYIENPTDKYRFGFNTQEKVDELSGAGNHNTALFWEYDTRLGRRWNVDPIYNGSESRYLCMGNNPIAMNDILGNKAIDFKNEGNGENGSVSQQIGKGVNAVVSRLVQIATLGTRTKIDENGYYSVEPGGLLKGLFGERKGMNNKNNKESNAIVLNAGKKGFPLFSELLKNYPLPYSRRPDRTPINRSKPLNEMTGDNFLYYNQCAIRLSISLRNSGVDLIGCRNVSNPGGSPYGNKNILGAKNLAIFLKENYLGDPKVYSGTKEDVYALIKGRKGIIYFQGIVEGGRRSDNNVHIELWDSDHYMSNFPFSQMLNAETIWFWPLK